MRCHLRIARTAALTMAAIGLWGTPVAAAAAAEVSEGPKRVDFDDRLVRGQRRQAGTVYIFQREKVELRSMVNRPRTFRHRIITSVFKD